jgi:hypothetical protein
MATGPKFHVALNPDSRLKRSENKNLANFLEHLRKYKDNTMSTPAKLTAAIAGRRLLKVLMNIRTNMSQQRKMGVSTRRNG